MCIVKDCTNKVFAKGYCSKHYSQLYRNGKILERSVKDLNEIKINGDYTEIALYNKGGKIIDTAIIDKEDIEKVKNYKWYRTDKQRSTYYCNNNKIGRLHRLILDIDDLNIIIDHINHNGLDNRKDNLRICTTAQNIRNCNIPKNNKSGYKGVYFDNNRQKWVAQITIKNKTISLGRYDSIEKAIEARLYGEREYYEGFGNQ